MTTHIATISPKGQVTIPNEIRDRAMLSSGDRVEFQMLRDGTILLRRLNLGVSDLFGAIAYDGPALSVDEINAGIIDGATAGARP